MIRSKMNPKIMLNILLISMFSLVYGSEQPKKPVMLDGLKITRNNQSITQNLQPRVMDESTTDQQAKIFKEVKRREEAAKIKAHLAEIEDKTTFVLAEKIEEPAQLTKPTPAPSNKLGDPYLCPTLPEQNKKEISKQSFFQSLEDYLNQIIKTGEFKAAHEAKSSKKQYPKINEDSGEVLTTHVAIITAMLKQHNQEKQEFFTNHRSAFATALNRLRLLIRANQEFYAKGSINQQRIENALAELQEAQKTQESANDPLIAELNTLEIVLHETRKELLTLHPTADKQSQIPDRRIISILPAPTTK